MKRLFMMLLAAALVTALAACGAPAETPPAETAPAAETTAAAEPTQEPAQEPVPEPTANEPVMPQTVEEVVGAMLVNPQVLFGEGIEQMAENTGGQFGGIDVKQPQDGYFQFITEKNGAWMPYNTRLMDVAGSGNANQAFRMKFQPESVSGLLFSLIGMGEVSVAFKEDGLYFTYVDAGTTTNFSDYMPNNFEFAPDRWYNILMAFDAEANLRCIAWEDGNYENRAFYEEPLYIGGDNIYESNWEVVIGFDKGCTLNVSDYDILTFEGLTENPPVG